MAHAARVVYCRCVHAELVPRAVQDEVLRRLSEAGVAFEAVDDLCELGARRDPRLREVAEAEAACVVACYPRAVKWLFAAGGAPLPDGRVALLNLREESAERIVAAVRQSALGSDSPSVIRHSPFPASTAGWIPWFPVIDYGRCTDCRQCLNFCLFGVFGLAADGTVAVERPEKCKTNCPACARVCPEAAIIFPKYGKAPINGAEVRPEDLQREKMKTDPSGLLRGDVYAALRRRGSGLAELRDRLDIPPEVLAALPAAELQAKARQAFDPKPPAAPGGRDCPCERDGAGECESGCDCDCGPECDCEPPREGQNHE